MVSGLDFVVVKPKDPFQFLIRQIIYRMILNPARTSSIIADIVYGGVIVFTFSQEIPPPAAITITSIIITISFILFESFLSRGQQPSPLPD